MRRIEGIEKKDFVLFLKKIVKLLGTRAETDGENFLQFKREKVLVFMVLTGSKFFVEFKNLDKKTVGSIFRAMYEVWPGKLPILFEEWELTEGGEVLFKDLVEVFGVLSPYGFLKRFYPTYGL